MTPEQILRRELQTLRAFHDNLQAMYAYIANSNRGRNISIDIGNLREHLIERECIILRELSGVDIHAEDYE